MYNVEPTVNKDGEKVFEFAYTGQPVDFSVESVTDVFGTELTADEDYTVAFYTVEGTKTFADKENEGAAPTEAGTYLIGITTAGDYAATYGETAQTHYQPFTIKEAAPVSIAGATPYVVNPNDEGDLSKTEFTYTGQAYKWNPANVGTNDIIGIAVDGKALEYDKDFKVTSNPTILDAGTYNVTIEAVEGSSYVGTAYLKITVNPIDLSSALVTIADQVHTGNVIDYAAGISLNGDPLSGFEGANIEYAITGYQLPNVGGVPTEVKELGKYTVQIAADEDAAVKNFTGSTTATFNVVETKVADEGYEYTYGEDAKTFADWADSLVFDNSKKDSAFDVKNITVTHGEELTYGEDYTVTVTRDGEEVTEYTQPGDYVATVQIVVDEETFELGGTAELKFSVTNGTVEPSSVFVSVDGKNVVAGEDNAAEVSYTGSAIEPVVVVKSGDKALAAGTDYEVAYSKYNDKSGKYEAVESIVEPGKYAIAVSSDSYELDSSANTFYVTVGKIAITQYRVAQTTVKGSGEVADITGIPYTGEPVEVVIEYTTVELKDSKVPEDAEWTVLDPSLYEATFTLDDKAIEASEVVNADEYKANIELTKDAEALYTAPATTTATFKVIDLVGYADVHVTDWFADYVYTAKGLEYMTGLAGTNLFVPNSAITRAEIAQVIFNMAAVEVTGTLPPTDFDDVAESEWYVKAIAFVNGAGIMTGYDDNDSFGVNDNATREQIATTMYRYAKVIGIDTTVEDEAAALAKYNDGAQVSDWAKTAVAWAVEHEIMGVDVTVLNPQGDVTRAEVAAIATRVQPEKLQASDEIQ